MVGRTIVVLYPEPSIIVLDFAGIRIAAMSGIYTPYAVGPSLVRTHTLSPGRER